MMVVMQSYKQFMSSFKVSIEMGYPVSCRLLYPHQDGVGNEKPEWGHKIRQGVR
jgi:hypothetical protein